MTVRQMPAGADACLSAATAAHRTWADACHTAIAALAAAGAPFTAEDVRALALLNWHQPGQTTIDGQTVGEQPSHNVLPAAMNAAATAGTIRTVGYRPATRASRRGGILRIWAGADTSRNAA